MFVILIVSFNPDCCFVYVVTHIEQGCFELMVRERVLLPQLMSLVFPV